MMKLFSHARNLGRKTKGVEVGGNARMARLKKIKMYREYYALFNLNILFMEKLLLKK